MFETQIRNWKFWNLLIENWFILAFLFFLWKHVNLNREESHKNYEEIWWNKTRTISFLDRNHFFKLYLWKCLYICSIKMSLCCMFFTVVPLGIEDLCKWHWITECHWSRTNKFFFLIQNLACSRIFSIFKTLVRFFC